MNVKKVFFKKGIKSGVTYVQLGAKYSFEFDISYKVLKVKLFPYFLSNGFIRLQIICRFITKSVRPTV